MWVADARPGASPAVSPALPERGGRGGRGVGLGQVEPDGAGAPVEQAPDLCLRAGNDDHGTGELQGGPQAGHVEDR